MVKQKLKAEQKVHWDFGKSQNVSGDHENHMHTQTFVQDQERPEKVLNSQRLILRTDYEALYKRSELKQ